MESVEAIHVALTDCCIRKYGDQIDGLCRWTDVPFETTGEHIPEEEEGSLSHRIENIFGDRVDLCKDFAAQGQVGRREDIIELIVVRGADDR